MLLSGARSEGLIAVIRNPVFANPEGSSNSAQPVQRPDAFLGSRLVEELVVDRSRLRPAAKMP
jgi:hypothetical protein